jgi:FkbM family methyltransferase
VSDSKQDASPTRTGFGALEPPLLAAKWAVFHLLCGGDVERYLALRGKLMRRVASWGLYERKQLRFLSGHLRPGDVAIDVGANLGAYTVAMSRAVGSTGQVFAFEPMAEAYRELRACTAKLSNVHCFNLALSDRADESAQMTVPLLFGSVPEPALASLSQSRFAFARQLDVRRVAAARLDDCFPSSLSVNFIKVDIEGHEPAFFRGAEAVIARSRPLIQFEVIDMASARGSWDAVAAAHDYALCCIDANGRLRRLTASSHHRGINFYLAPSERIRREPMGTAA